MAVTFEDILLHDLATNISELQSGKTLSVLTLQLIFFQPHPYCLMVMVRCKFEQHMEKKNYPKYVEKPYVDEMTTCANSVVPTKTMFCRGTIKIFYYTSAKDYHLIIELC